MLTENGPNISYRLQFDDGDTHEPVPVELEQPDVRGKGRVPESLLAAPRRVDIRSQIGQQVEVILTRGVDSNRRPIAAVVDRNAIGELSEDAPLDGCHIRVSDRRPGRFTARYQGGCQRDRSRQRAPLTMVSGSFVRWGDHESGHSLFASNAHVGRNGRSTPE